MSVRFKTTIFKFGIQVYFIGPNGERDLYLPLNVFYEGSTLKQYLAFVLEIAEGEMKIDFDEIRVKWLDNFIWQAKRDDQQPDQWNFWKREDFKQI